MLAFSNNQNQSGRFGIEAAILFYALVKYPIGWSSYIFI
jgi:hypothetical protein